MQHLILISRLVLQSIDNAGDEQVLNDIHILITILRLNLEYISISFRVRTLDYTKVKCCVPCLIDSVPSISSSFY